MPVSLPGSIGCCFLLFRERQKRKPSPTRAKTPIGTPTPAPMAAAWDDEAAADIVAAGVVVTADELVEVDVTLLEVELDEEEEVTYFPFSGI